MRWWPFGSRDGSAARGSSRAAQARDERLSAYLDDDLTAEDRAAVEAELSTDDTLRDELAGMRAVTGALASLEPVRAPRPFTLEAAPAPAPSGRPRILDLGLQLGAALSALLLVVVIVNPGGGDSLGDAIPVEQSRIGETSLQFSAGNDDTDAGAAAAGGGAAAPEAAPSDGGEESGAGEGSSPPPTEGLRSDATPSAASGSSGASSGSDTGELAPPQPATITPAPPADASTADAPPRDVAPADTTTSDNDDGSTKTPPPPAETGPGTPPSTGGAANLGDATTIEPQPAGGDTADTAAVAPEAGTEEAIAASDLGGDDGTDFVPAFAVLTALLTALAALRWAQTRRTA